MAPQGVTGPPFPIFILQARILPVRTAPAPRSYTQPQPLAVKYYQNTNRFLSLPSDLRRKLLEYLVVSHDNEIGVRIPPCELQHILDRGWTDDHKAISCCCRQLSHETSEVFIRQNNFVFEDISQARFLKRFVYLWEPRFFANMRSLRLGPYSMLPPSCATTELSEMHYYYEDFLEAMEPFWGITPLQVTLPWDFELQKWQDLMGYVHGAFPNVTEFTIDRPNVDFLLPDALASHETFNLPENSYNTLFWPHCVTNHPLGFEFPANISQILIQTDQDIYFVNEMHVPLGRTAIRLTPESDIIRDIWRNSLDGLLPSPGYNSKTKRLVGGEEKRRMFPHWYPEDPPPEPAPTPSPGLQPYQDFIQPNHFQQS